MCGKLNGPPCGPKEVRPPAGDTDNAPVGTEGNTFKLNGRVVFPILLVVFVKDTVSL